MPQRLREQAPGFVDSTSLCWRQTRRPPAGDRCATFPPPARRDLEGTREEQSAAVPAA